MKKIDFSKFKAIILDIDGTLTISRDSEELSIEAITAIRKFIKKRPNIDLGIATGNTHVVAYALAKYIGLNAKKGPIISENGCILWYNGVEYDLCTDEYTRFVFKIVLEKLKDLIKPSYQHICRKFDLAFYSKINPKIVYSKVIEILKENNLLNYVDIKFSGYAFHIIPKGIDKGYAILKYCEISGIKPEEIIVIGDSETDLSMFKIAGLKVAVSNADEILKKYADIVLDKESGLGVAEFLERMLSELN